MKNVSSIDRQLPIRYFLQIVFKHKKLIILLFISIVGTVTVGNLMMPPEYKSTAKLLLERQVDSEQALLFRMEFNRDDGSHNWVNSEIEIIRSRSVITRVIKEMHMLNVVDQDGNELPGDSLVLEEAIENFLKKMAIEPTKDATVVEISFRANNPHRAARILESIIRNYKIYRQELYQQSSRYKFIEAQIKEAEKRLRALEKRQSEFKTKSGLAIPDEHGKILYQKLADFEKQLTEVRAKRIGLEARLNILKKEFRKGKEISLTTAIGDIPSARLERINGLKAQLLEKEIKLARVSEKFTPKYEEYVQLKKEIEAIRKKIKEEIELYLTEQEADVQARKLEEAVLQNNINRIRQELKKFAENQFELEQLSRGIDENREVYSILIKQREEARISLAKAERGVQIRVISPPSIPVDPISPKRRLNVMLSAILSILIALGIAFGQEFLRHTVSTPEEVELALGIPVLGCVQHFEAKGYRNGCGKIPALNPKPLPLKD